MAEVLNKALTPIATTNTALIDIKLNWSNYALWSQVVEMFISGRDKLGYINDDLPQLVPTDPLFQRWRTKNVVVKGWLNNTMDSSLVSTFIQYPIVKEVWDTITIIFFDGSDTTQVYELQWRVSRLRQNGGSLEKFYNELQGLWREIDFWRPNPMECPKDLQRYTRILQEERVYVFLDDLDYSTKSRAPCYRCNHFRQLSKPTHVFWGK